MSVFHLRNFIRSFKYAFKGWSYAWGEQSFKILVLAALIVIFLMIYFGVSAKEAVILILVITSVLVLEMINSIFEKISDLLKPRVHFGIENIKDLMAGAVLLAAIAALTITILIFWPYFLSNG